MRTRPASRVTCLAAAANLGQPSGLGGQSEHPREPAIQPEGRTLEEQHEVLFSLPGVYAPLPPHVVPLFVESANRLASTYLHDPTEQHLLEILALVKVGLVPDLAPGRLRSLKTRLAHYPLVRIPDPRPQPESDRLPTSQGQRAARQIELGRLSRAGRILTESASMAPRTAETVDALRALHPVGPDDPFGNTAWAPLSHLRLDHACLVRALKTFAPDTEPGISGWSVPLLSPLMKEPNAPFSKFLLQLTRQIANGAAPGQQMLCASRLLALEKPGGGVRPLGVGELIYRLAMKAILAVGFSGHGLLPSQFGVGTPGGVEPLLRLIERAVDGSLPVRFDHLADVDLRNAFNEVDRTHMADEVRRHCPGLYRAAKWAYGASTKLFYRGPNGLVELASSQGVKQGDPLGNCLFSIAYRPVLEDVQRELGPDALASAYLDNTSILSIGSQMQQVFEIFARHAHRGFHLRPDKCHDYNLSTPDVEIETLGGYIGPRPEAFLRRQIVDQIRHLGCLDELPAQHALLLLRFSIQQRLRHLMRTLPPTPAVLEAWQTWDKSLRLQVLRLRGARTAEEQFDHRILKLPIRHGGLGVLSHEDCAPHARTAMTQASDLTVAALLPSMSETALLDVSCLSQRERCRPMFEQHHLALVVDLPAPQRLMFAENLSRLSSQWLQAIPYNKYNLLTKEEVGVGLSLRTLMTGHNPVCRYCALENSLGHDDVCLQRHNWRTHRHEALKTVLAYHLRRVQGTEVTVEPHIPGRLDRTDLRLVGPASYLQASSDYDLAIVSVFTVTVLPPSAARDPASLWQATKKTIVERLDTKAAEKTRRYAGLTPSAFHPIIFSSGGTPSSSTQLLLDFWRTVMTDETYLALYMSLGISLLRARARSFVL